MKKKITVVVLAFFVFLFLFASSKNVNASVCASIPACYYVGLPCCPPGCSGTCTGSNPGSCYNGPSNTDSGGCGTPCREGPAWSQYTAQCLNDCRPGDPECCSYHWVYNTYLCSTADKCVQPSDNALHSGNCNCSVGGIYKYCCDASGNPEGCILGYPQDTNPPPEGQCPGGYLIDGNRVRSSPCTGSGPTPTLAPGQPSNPPIPTGTTACAYWCQNAGSPCPAGCTTESGACDNGGPCCNCPSIPTSGPSGSFDVEVPANICIEDGVNLKVKQHQDIKYDWINVNIDKPGFPFRFTVCRAGNFNDPATAPPPPADQGSRFCFWDTMHIENAEDYDPDDLPTGPYPAGAYVVSVLYPGSPPKNPRKEVFKNTNLDYCYYKSIGGRVTDATKTTEPKGIAGVPIDVYDSTLTVNNHRYPVTNGNGYWSANDLVRTDHFYSVRVIGNQVFPQTAPLGYLPPARTNEAGWNWNYCRNPNPGTFPWEDTPLGSASYECQKAGSGIDCASSNGVRDKRCSFSYDSSKSCNDTCTVDSDCKSGYCNHLSFLLDVCRNRSCPDSTVTDIFGNCVCPISTPTPTSIPTPTPRPVVSWFQTTGGDIQARFDIVSRIPNCATNKSLSLAGTGGTTGVVGYGDSLIVAPEGLVSWQAKTYTAPTIGFEYLANRLKIDRTVNNFDGDLSSSGIFYSPENVKIDDNFVAGRNITAFVDGDVTIQNNLVVPEGSFLAIISSGNLSFLDTVTKAQGFFLAGGTLSIEAGSNQFEGQGSFVGLDSGGISFLRDLANNCNPAETFIERPDFFINAPDEFKITGSYFKEIEP